MNTLHNYIIKEAEEAVANEIVNNKPTDILHLEESPLTWQKVAKLTPEAFNNIFKDKSIILCVPCTSVSSMFNGKFADDAKKRNPMGYYGGSKSIIVISSINENTCEVVDIEFTPSALYNSWSHHHSDGAWTNKNYKIPIKDVIASIGGLRLTRFQKDGGSKLWVINIDKFGNRGEYGFRELFAPFYKIINTTFDKYNEILDKAEEVIKKCRDIQDVFKLRKNSTWNYAVLNRKGYGRIKFALVGYRKGVIITHEYAHWPVFSQPYSISVSQFAEIDVTDRRTGNGMPGYKITDKIYEKVFNIIKPLDSLFDNMRTEFKQLYSQWVKKFMLGEPIDFDKIEKVADKENAKIGNDKDELNKVDGIKTPEEAEKIEVTENPTDEKKTRGKNTELSKGAKKDAEGKMDAWHNGTRKQNVKNLSDAKLKLNYSICKTKGYEEEMKQLEDEAKKRELTLESKILLNDYVSILTENNAEEDY